MICQKCGTRLADDSAFCPACGTKVETIAQVLPEQPDAGQQPIDTKGAGPTSAAGPEAAVSVLPRPASGGTPTLPADQPAREGGAENNEPPAEPAGAGKKGDGMEWWDSLSTYKKGSAIAIAVCFLMLGIFFIISHWKSILGIVVAIVIVLGAITSLVQMVKNSASGSKETRTKARRGLIFCAVLCVVFGAMIFSALRDHDPYFFQPGSSVHNSYLTQINAHETIGKVFCDYFEGGKWSTYKENGYSYAAFSATGRFWGERADVQIVFRVKEDEFFLDHMDVNGHEQDELTTLLLLSEIYGEALI